jgi:hypothetical protein
MNIDNWPLPVMLIVMIVLGLVAVALAFFMLYWIWMGFALLVGTLLGAVVGAFLYGYHLFI